ncbi:hypothetical protein OSB04_024504 [Centaurea solstitialis]|uniref:Reverse transcriptase zinc-binding domain-containing protein n=1 Tax=Centaurea solstitialis TaxID=347529 RepID=A0AA38T4P8_9ASTR|nr:hypothetical protein OSB04_024504 [Centaurea solstitialis]
MRWLNVITPYLSQIINIIIQPFSDDPDPDTTPVDERVLTHNQEHQLASNRQDGSDPWGLEDEIVPEVDEQDNNESLLLVRVPLPKKRKLCFYIFYSIFVILYVVFFLLIAYAYPLKPVCTMEDLKLPGYNKTASANMSEEMKKSVYVNFTCNNRNRLISASYDQLSIVIYYYLPEDLESYYLLASIMAPGFYLNKLKQKIVKVHMPAPGLPSLLKLGKPLTEVGFRVNLEFGVRFGCRAPCELWTPGFEPWVDEILHHIPELQPLLHNSYSSRILCNRLATKDNLDKRGMELQSLDCQLCYSRAETLDHIVAACSTTRMVSAYLSRCVKWWPVNETFAQSIWTAIYISNGERDTREKDVKKVIGAAFFWTIYGGFATARCSMV